MAHTKKWIRNEKRLAIYLRDNCQCIYCGKTLLDKIMLSLDHILPRNSGISDNTPNNLITSCVNCNSARQDKNIQEYLTLIMGDNAHIVMAKIVELTQKDIKPYLLLAKKMIVEQDSYSQALESMG